MKKRKKLVAKAKNKNIRRKNRIRINNFLIGGLAGILILLSSLLVIYLSNTFPKTATTKKVVSDTNEIKTASSVFPSSIITPTIIHKSEEKPPGYCLNVPVLLYHHIKPIQEAQKAGHEKLTIDNAVFESHMAYLKNSGYTSISAQQLVDGLRNKTPLPQKSVVVTIDDGYSDVYTYAYPIAQKYGMILNLMVSTGLIGNNGYFTWDQLREMINSGSTHVYNHTWSHASLASLPKEKIEYEILTAQQQLKDSLGKAENIFTYPYGSLNDTVINILKSNGFIGAFSTISGFSQCDSYIMSLHRTHVGNVSLSTYGL